MAPCQSAVKNCIQITSHQTSNRAKDMDIILPIRLANFLAGIHLASFTSSNLDFNASILDAGTENSPTDKSI